MNVPVPTSPYCRICFKEKGLNLKPMSEDVRDDFYALTDILLIKSDIYSNFVCTFCVTKINDTRKYREELIANELRLMNEIQFIPGVKLEPESSMRVQETNPGIDSIGDVDKFEGIVDDMMRGDSDSYDEWKLDEPTTSRPRHKKKKHRSPKIKFSSNDEDKAFCSYCSKSIIRSYLPKHIERMHMGQKNYTCDKCGKKFYRQSTIEAHMDRHMNVLYNCTYAECPRQFQFKSSLRNHLKLHHSDVYEFFCEFCAMKFKAKYQLQEHITTKHQGHRFKCTYEGCTSEYLSNTALTYHIQAAHEYIMEPCEFCGKILRSGPQLMQHKRRRHSALNFACSHCDKRFANAPLLKAHEKVHLGQRDYVCNLCNSSYFIKKNLNRHMKIAHQKTKFFCRVPGCKSILCNKDNYRAHLRTVHKGMNPQEMSILIAEIAEMKPDYLEEDVEGREVSS